MVDKIVAIDKGSRMIYCTAESSSVDLQNTPLSYRKMEKIFPYILTWNDKRIDNKSIFRRAIPYSFIGGRLCVKAFEDKFYFK